MMKVLTVKQPWATLIAEGYKKYEFRTWQTKYRGELYIHAGLKVDREAMKKFAHLNLEYPKSKIIAKVNLLDCIKLDDDKNKKIINENKLIYGSKFHTGYAWVISDVVRVDLNQEIKGKLSIWNYNDN